MTDVEKARAIFRWVTVKNLNSIMSSTLASNFRQTGGGWGAEGPSHANPYGAAQAAARQHEEGRFNLFGVQSPPNMELVG